MRTDVYTHSSTGAVLMKYLSSKFLKQNRPFVVFGLGMEKFFEKEVNILKPTSFKKNKKTTEERFPFLVIDTGINNNLSSDIRDYLIKKVKENMSDYTIITKSEDIELEDTFLFRGIFLGEECLDPSVPNIFPMLTLRENILNVKTEKTKYLPDSFFCPFVSMIAEKGLYRELFDLIDDPSLNISSYVRVTDKLELIEIPELKFQPNESFKEATDRVFFRGGSMTEYVFAAGRYKDTLMKYIMSSFVEKGVPFIYYGYKFGTDRGIEFEAKYMLKGIPVFNVNSFANIKKFSESEEDFILLNRRVSPLNFSKTVPIEDKESIYIVNKFKKFKSHTLIIENAANSFNVRSIFKEIKDHDKIYTFSFLAFGIPLKIINKIKIYLSIDLLKKHGFDHDNGIIHDLDKIGVLKKIKERVDSDNSKDFYVIDNGKLSLLKLPNLSELSKEEFLEFEI